MTKRYFLELTEAEIGSVRATLAISLDSQEADQVGIAHKLRSVVTKIDATEAQTARPLFLTVAEARALTKAVDNSLGDGGDFLKDWYNTHKEREAAKRGWARLNAHAREDRHG